MSSHATDLGLCEIFFPSMAQRRRTIYIDISLHTQHMWSGGEAWFLGVRPGTCGRGLVPVGEAWSLWERPGPCGRGLVPVGEAWSLGENSVDCCCGVFICRWCFFLSWTNVIVMTREHWIQRITFTVETNAADTHSVTGGCLVVHSWN